MKEQFLALLLPPSSFSQSSGNVELYSVNKFCSPSQSFANSSVVVSFGEYHQRPSFPSTVHFFMGRFAPHDGRKLSCIVPALSDKKSAPPGVCELQALYIHSLAQSSTGCF